MKRNVTLILSLLALLFAAACSGDDGGVSDTSTNAEGENEVLLWHYYTGSEEVLNEFVTEFNNSQDEVVVKSEYVPFNEMSRQLSVGTAGGTLPDVVIMDTVNNASMASMGILADLTEEMEEWGIKDQFLDGPLNSTVLDGKNYGVPLTTNSLGLFYNKTLLEEAGVEPPETWAELEEAAAKLTTDSVKGMGLSAVKSEESTFQFYPFIYSAGATYQSLDSPEAAEAFNFIKGMLDKGYMSQDVLTSTQDDLNRKFVAGDLAMMINGPWMIDQIKESGTVDFGITQIPKDESYASVTGGDNIAITKDGNQEAAWTFVQWLLEKEQNEKFAQGTGYFPTRSDVLNEAEYWKNEELVKEFIPIMEVAEARGPSANWPKVSEAIQLAIQEILTGEKATEEALEEAAAKIEEVEN